MTVCRECGESVTPSRYAAMCCGDCWAYFHSTIRLDHIAEAQRILTLAVLNEELPKPDLLRCVDCGKPADVYDHRDYSLPLKVDPVCRSCNWKRGRAAASDLGAWGHAVSPKRKGSAMPWDVAA